MQAYLNSIQIASMAGMRKGILNFGPANTTVLLFENLMDSKALWLTPNTVSIYMAMWLELKDEPMVIETPPNVLGIIDDAWFHYVTDFGNAGEDRGKGGKYLLVPPEYQGNIPDGYIVKKSETYGHWLAMRGFMKDFEADPVVKNMKDHFRLYPLGRKPKEVNWVNVAMEAFNRAVELDPGFGPYQVHPLELTIAAGDRAAADSAFERYRTSTEDVRNVTEFSLAHATLLVSSLLQGCTTSPSITASPSVSRLLKVSAGLSSRGAVGDEAISKTCPSTVGIAPSPEPSSQ